MKFRSRNADKIKIFSINTKLSKVSACKSSGTILSNYLHWKDHIKCIHTELIKFVGHI
jgi:hypothetical protein